MVANWLAFGDDCLAGRGLPGVDSHFGAQAIPFAAAIIAVFGVLGLLSGAGQ
jgi:hypothetical protein